MTSVAKLPGLAEAGLSMRERIMKEVDLFAAIHDHVTWVNRLQDYMNGKSKENLDPMVVCCDDQCALGKWIHNVGLKHFYMDDSFHQLRSNHARFHVMIGNVVKHVQENNRSAAESLLEGEYKQTWRKLSKSLTQLE